MCKEIRDWKGLIDYFQLLTSWERSLNSGFYLVHCILLKKVRFQQSVPLQGLEQIKGLVMSLNYKLHEHKNHLVFLIAESPGCRLILIT